MADVVFCQMQKFFNSDPFERWARLIVYEDEYSDCLESASPFLFQFNEKRCIGTQRIQVGISEDDTIAEYEEHQEEIVKLLEEENLKPQVLFYTTADRFKEAFYGDCTNSMKWNCKVNDEKEVMYWSYCGKNDCALLVAFEDLSIYREGLEYFCDFSE